MEDRITDLWWTGIRLWYNDQDFLRAMQVWDEAIDCALEESCHNANDVVPKSPAVDPLPPSSSLTSTEEEMTALNSVAPLLLFMAGCYLDAGNALKAQQLCRWCLSTKMFHQSLLLESTTINNSNNNSDNFAHCVLSEYTAAFQEDLTIEKPCDKAYQVVEWAIQKRQQALDEGQALSTSLSSHSCCWTHPYQRPAFFYASLSSQAVYTRDQHPNWCRQLEEEHYPTIRDEYQRLLRLHHPKNNGNDTNSTAPQHWPRVGAGDHREGAGQHDASVVEKGGDWREIVLFGIGGERGPVVAPQTCRILEQVAPEAVDLARQGAGEIIFSVLAPNTHISPHCASTNLRLTAHLGLQIPNNNDNDDSDNDQCYIQVADEKLHWKEGKIIVFDDGFQHEVHNDTNEIRAVLLLRFWHFNLPRDERHLALQQLLDAKEADRQRRCNPPLPLPTHHAMANSNSNDQTGMKRNPQGMNQKPCPACGRAGFESIRVQPETGLFQCLCGQEVASN